ncbi:FtsQ-type POTRA domain-containing protein [Mangrovimicrobium sediminis]|uniref:Cell division protein FtsQ n=1 Tax=Mangrovimicrobium sediminis TaxID=2562682 RepID=A0A4Z0M2Z8_9GAMM|nr:cell division protein FtsQ/DivIB [Haliea sp. SAOS-164]TGD74063.1 FtsQ-type POTRA domain-containing protein [Haliea sp. SAOS-164]
MGVAIRLPTLRRAPQSRRPRSGEKDRPAARKARVEQPGRARVEQPRRARDEQPRQKTQAAKRAGNAHGATRKAAPAAERAPRSFRWLERIFILLAVGVVLAAGLKGWIALQSRPVQQITVTGELAHTRPEAVREMVEPELAGGFIGADLGELSQRLEALPWVYRASVRRVWPNSLEISIAEQLPIARWGEGGFLNHQGEIFQPAAEQGWESLPQLRGPDRAAPTLMRTYQRLVELLAPLGLDVTELSCNERGEIAAVLSGGQTLVIGGTDFLERMQRFAAVYRAELAAQMDSVERIDLRYAHGIAVAFLPPAEPAEDTTDDNGKV